MTKKEHMIELRDQYISVESMEQSIKVLEKLVFAHAQGDKNIVLFQIKVAEKIGN